MTSKVGDYADWSVNDLFCELISYCQSNIEDATTEAMKAAILAKAHAEGVAEGAAEEREKWQKSLTHDGMTLNGVGYRIIPDYSVNRLLVPPILAPTKVKP